MNTKDVNILVVDDLEVSRNLLSWKLEEHGFHIYTAVRGDEAIGLVQEKDGKIDYVLMDQVLMDGMDGIVATQRIHQQYPEIRTIVLTLYGDGESSRQALDAHAYRYVFRSSKLEETIEEIVALIESADELAQIEKSLSSSEAVSTIFQGAGAALGVVDRSYRILYSNDAQDEIAGGKSRRGGICWVEWHQAYQQKGPCAWCPVKPLFENVESSYRIFPLVSHGKVQYLQTGATPILDSQGKIVAATKWAVDVTEREQARMSALEAHGVEEHLEAALNQVVMLGYSRARLFEISQDGKTLVGRKQVGGLEKQISQLRCSLNEYPNSKEFLRKKDSVFYCKQSTRPESFLGCQMDLKGVEEWLEVPLRGDAGRLIGLMLVDNKIIGDVRPDRPSKPRPIILSEHSESLKLIAEFAANTIREERENKKTNQELELQRQLRALDAQIAGELDVDRLLLSIVDRATGLLKADGGSLHLCDPVKKNVSVKCTYRLQALEGLILDYGEGLAGRIAETGQTTIVDDYSTWEGRSPQLEQEKYRNIFHAMIGVPILRGETVIGVLNISYREPGRFFSNVDADTLKSFAVRAAIALHNAQLFSDLQSRLHELEIINKVGQGINTELTKVKLKELEQYLVSEIAIHLNCTHCTLFLPRIEHGEIILTPEVTHGVTFELISGRHFRKDEGLAGWSFTHGEAIVLDDARQDARFAAARVEQNVPRSMLVIPLKSGTNVVGVFSADQDIFGHFNENSRRLVEALASQAAVAIDNVRLFEKTRRQADEMSALFETSTALSRQQDIHRILNLFVEQSRKLIDFDSCAIRFVDKYAHVLRPRLAVGLNDVQIKQYLVPFGKGIVGDVARRKRAEIVNLAHKDPRAVRIPGTEEAPQAILAIPLMVRGRVIGVANLDRYEGKTFTEDDLRVMTTIANQVSIAIGNRMSFDQQRRRARQLSAISQVAAAMLSEDDPETVLRIALTGVTAEPALSFSRAMYFEASEDGKLLQGKLAIGAMTKKEAERNWRSCKELKLGDYLDSTGLRQTGPQGSLDKLVREITVPISEQAGALALCFLSRKNQIVFGSRQRKGRNPQLAQRLGLDSYAVVPFIAKGEPKGVLLIDYKYLRYHISEDDLRMVETLASQAAIALQNALLFKQLEERFGDIAHTLRSPIADIRGFTQLLADGRVTDPHQTQEYYAFILAAMEDFESTANDMLNMKKIEAGVLTFQKEMASIRDIVQKAINFNRYSARVMNITIEQSFQHSPEEDMIMLDKDKMEMAVQVLVENAIHFSHYGGNVNVMTRSADGHLEIIVKDEGWGIPKDEIPKLFKKYFRGKIAERERIDGTGIGLTTASYIVKKHGGRITLDSELGKGSTFVIHLPQ